jgi:rare lipoprotein A
MRGLGDISRSGVAARGFWTKAASLAAIGAALVVLAACAAPKPKAMLNTTKSKEYFAESEYGVKASPRVTSKRSRLPRGGGRDQVGKPYMVKGKWYYPKEDPNYTKVGTASWYGAAFHGRLTANGEIYDMTHLTAAHPTMPLPSYARVTNVNDGSSVVVRVNDRGPYTHGRIIDLSKRAAEMLGYTAVGTAKVQVEYLGRAPLHGQDDRFLMASYRPPGRGASPAPANEIAPGVMVAMAGPTPTVSVGASAVPFPGQMQTVTDGSDPVLPGYGPIPPERPLMDFMLATVTTDSMPRLSYADERIGRASEAFAALSGGMSAVDVLQSWKRHRPKSQLEFIAAGTFSSREEADEHSHALSHMGRTELQVVEMGGAKWYSVNLYQNGRYSLNSMLERAWSIGASDAIVVRE